MDGSSSDNSSVVVSEPDSDYVEEVVVEVNEGAQTDGTNTPNDQVEDDQIGTTNTDGNESTNETTTLETQGKNFKLTFKINLLVLNLIITDNTENNNDEENQQAREREARLRMIHLQFGSVSYDLIVQLDNYAEESLFQANDNSILCDIFSLGPIVGPAVFVAGVFHQAESFSNWRNTAILRNRSTFNCPITNRTINIRTDPVILLSRRANQRIEYLNSHHNVITTGEGVINTTNTTNIMNNVARAE